MLKAAKTLITQTGQDLKEMSNSLDLSFIRNAFSPGHRESKSNKDIPMTTLEDFLVYKNFDSRHKIFDNKTSYSFLLRVSPFSGIDRKAFNVLTQVISYEIPESAFVQLINFASPEIDNIVSIWEKVCSKEGIYKYLSSKRKDFYLSGCKTGLWNKSGDFVLRNFELYFSISFSKNQSNEANKDLIQIICEVRGKVIKALSNANCYTEVLNKNDLDNIFDQILAPVGSSNNVSYTMHPNYFEYSSDLIKKKYLIFEVDEWPKQWSITDSINYTGNFQTGRGLGFPFYLSYGFRIEDHRNSQNKAAKMRMLKTNQTTSKLAAFFPAMLEEIEDWQYVSGEVEKGARLTQTVMHIVAIIDSSMDVGFAEGAIKDHFYQLGFKVNQIKYDLLNNFIASLPMSMAEHAAVFHRQKVFSTLLTSSCINLLPIFADCQNYNSPLMMFAGRRGQIFFFDNYQSIENGNFNMIVVGKSGSGKSVFLQEYMTSILRRDGQVVVIDDGRSFQNSCNILAGDFVDFAGEKLCINPFSLYTHIDLKDEKFKVDFEELLIDLIVSILCIITNIDKNNTKHFDIGLYRDVLKKSVQIVLEEKTDSAGIKDVRDTLLNNKFLRTEQTADIADKLAYILREYADGRYSSYYNGRASLSINNLLTVFELSSLESNEVLQTSVLLMVVFLVYTKMQARTRRTSLIIDEAWRLLRHDAIKGFIEGIARRARKYNGNLVVATQSISDFDESRSSAAAAVLSQSDWRVLLSAEGKDEKILKEQLGMEPSEVDIAKNLRGDKGRYSEFIIRHSSASWLIGRLILDPFSAKLYSSKAEDVIAIKEMQRQGLSLAESIEQLLQQNKEN